MMIEVSSAGATALMRHCTDMVIMPRVKWFGGGGKDNHSWYRFDINHTAGPVLHAWGSVTENSRPWARKNSGYKPRFKDRQAAGGPGFDPNRKPPGEVTTSHH